MSVAAQLAQNSKLFISSSTTAPVNITTPGVTIGKLTKITATAHGLSNGDVVTFAGIVGTTQLNGVTAVVTAADANSFYINLDSTGFTPWTSGGTVTGNAWTQITQVKSIKPGGASASSIDVTDLDSTAHEFRTGLINNGTVAVEIYDKVSDAGQSAVLASFNASTTLNYKLALTGGSNRTFAAAVTKFPTAPDVSVDGVQTGTIDLQISGAVTRS